MFNVHSNNVKQVIVLEVADRRTEAPAKKFGWGLKISGADSPCPTMREKPLVLSRGPADH